MNYPKESKRLERLFGIPRRDISSSMVLRLVRQRGPQGAHKAILDLLAAPAAPSATVSRPDSMTNHPTGGHVDQEADSSD